MAEQMPAPPQEQQLMFTGFLPFAALVDSLSHSTRELASFGKLPSLQTRNASAAVRRGQLLCALADDIQDSGTTSTLTPSLTLCLTELLSVVRRTTSLLVSLADLSSLWKLLQTERIAHQFHVCVRELSRVLDVLPFYLLKLGSDAGETIELLHRQTHRADIFIDPSELRLRDDLMSLLPAGNHTIIDFNKLEQILQKVGIQTISDYEEEIEKLEAEVERQAGTGGLVAVANLNRLICMLKHSKSSIFHNLDGKTTPPSRRSSAEKMNNSSVMVLNWPDEFRCPITLDLMKDPVILASGHTYDRSSIARWINSGHHTCPKSGQRLIHMALIPNYALKSLIHQWCKDNNVPIISQDNDGGASSSVINAQAVDHISATRTAREAVRMTAEFLVGKLAVGSLQTQRQAAYELRLLAKTGMDNRRVIAEAGAIPFLVTLLSSPDPRTQENAVTALLNLSILDTNKILIMAAGAIDAIVDVLRSGLAMEARENAAATIFSLSLIDECKVAIGGRPEAVAGLVELLRDGTPTGKRDAVTALVNLALYQGNRAAVVAAGAVAVLVEFLMDESAGVTDNALALLTMLWGCAEGMKEIKENRAVMPVMVDLLRYGSAKGKENSVALLLGLCRGGEEMGRRLLMNPRSVPSLRSLTASGSARTNRKAEALLRLLDRYCSESQSQSSI